MKRILYVIFLIAVCCGACNTEFVKGRTANDIHFYSRTFRASPNECYYALRWAIKISGYSLANENLKDGVLTTTWMATTADSHYLPQFGRRDYGVTGAYHQIEVRVVPEGDRTRVDVGSRVKSIVSNLQSSGVEEQKVLAQVGNYLRTGEPTISNEGIAE